MARSSQPTLLSLVIPIYNEEAALPDLKASIENWKKSLVYPLELILVDDGSTDESRTFLDCWATDDTSVKAIFFSRNFGHQAALTAGLRASTGDVVGIIDADLQDPLEVIPSMVEKYQEGYDVVYGKRKSRAGESPFKKFSAWCYYRLLKTMTGTAIPEDTGDFRIMSRKSLNAVLEMNEVHRFLRGMIAWAGFRQIAVEYERRPRNQGITKFNLSRMVAFALNGIFSFSIVPIRLISLSGLAVSLFGAAYGVYSILRRFLIGDTVKGWPTIIVLICLMGGMILISLGIIGEYIARIYEESKHRPLYIVDECRNLSKPDAI